MITTEKAWLKCVNVNCEYECGLHGDFNSVYYMLSLLDSLSCPRCCSPLEIGLHMRRVDYDQLIISSD